MYSKLLNLLSHQEGCVQSSAGTHPGRRGLLVGSCGVNPSGDGVVAHSLAFLVYALEPSLVFQFLSCSGVFQPLELHLGVHLSSLLLLPLQRICGGFSMRLVALLA